ncbi:MAG: hypothetical protein HY040_14625 [Planctomycetes bacterium]|nr:hypothetical protein [Planctomycetota bacterium]
MPHAEDYPELQSLSQELQGFGDPKSVYVPNRLVWFGVAICYAAIAGSAALACFAVWSMFQPGQIRAQDLLGMRVALGAGLATIVMCGLFAWVGHRAGRQRAVLCRHGVFVLRTSGVDAARWDEVTEFYRSEVRMSILGISVWIHRRYDLITVDGRKLLLTEFFRKVARLGQAIEYEVSSKLWPKVLAAVNAGEEVAFWRLKVSRQGLRTDQDKLVRWERFDFVGVEAGLLRIHKVGEYFNWFRESLGAIPNVHVFLALSEHFRGVKSR